jgi:hypothetical protein
MAASPLPSASIVPLTLPIATVLVLADLRPMAERIRSVLADLSAAAAQALDQDVERTGRAVLFRGEPAEGLQLARALQCAGLTTSVNTLIS